MDRQQEISLKSTGMLDLLNAWNKDAMAGAGAASLDQEVNWGRGDGCVHCHGTAWVLERQMPRQPGNCHGQNSNPTWLLFCGVFHNPNWGRHCQLISWVKF